MAPFLGVRGGPCIEGEYTMTLADLYEGKRFLDASCIYDHVKLG